MVKDGHKDAHTKCNIATYSVANDSLEVLGTIKLQLYLFSTTEKQGLVAPGSFKAKHSFFITESLPHDIISGINFFIKYYSVLDLANKKMKVSHENITTNHNLYAVQAGQYSSTAKVTIDTKNLHIQTF